MMKTRVYLAALAPFRAEYPQKTKRELELLAGEYLVKTVCSGLLGISPNEVEILREQKPCLKNRNLQFNLSHTKDFLALAVSDVPVGIDLEKIEAIRPKVLESYFTQEEQKQVTEQGAACFYQIWTQKESYVKLTGEGIKALRKTEKIPASVGFYTERIFDHQLTVCTQKDCLPAKIELWQK